MYDYQGKMKLQKSSGNFTFQPHEARMFGPDIFFLLNSIKFLAPMLSGKFEFTSRKCQEILVNPGGGWV